MTGAGTVPVIRADRIGRVSSNVRSCIAVARPARQSTLVSCIIGRLSRPAVSTGSLGAASPPTG